MAIRISSDEGELPRVRPPSPAEIAAFRSRVTAHNPGVGIIDLLSGQIYLEAASELPGRDHASLVEKALRLFDIEQAGHVRGFVVGIDKGSWQIVNASGLNPLKNKMETALFKQVRAALESCLGLVP